MIGNAIAQSAQPIISYNYGCGKYGRVAETERLAILSAVGIGVIVTSAFLFFPSVMIGLFLDSDTEAAKIAVKGMPIFSTAFVFFIFRGCFIISVKRQDDEFLLKLHIMKREHSGAYVTDE